MKEGEGIHNGLNGLSGWGEGIHNGLSGLNGSEGEEFTTD